MNMLEILFAVLVLILLLILLVMQFRQPARSAQMLEQQHRAMLSDLHDGLNKQGDRLIAAQVAESERLRTAVGEELRATRDAVNSLQAKQELLRTEMLAQTLAKLAEQGRADQELIQNAFRNATQHLATSIEALSKTVDGRLEQIGGKVNERLDEGFKKTNETFVSVMTRLATIDEAQKKIDGLTTNMVSLQELLGDKRSRGAFGEVQLEALVRNIMPPQSYEMQYTLPNGTRADCVLKLPEPTGMVAVDSKFPLENYHRMFGADTAAEKLVAEKQFKADIKKHVDDIAGKYIISEVTSDGAVMFIPAEAVFAEIHAHHPEVVDYAMQRRVWIVSPTTLMAVLNTARAVMKDVETRKQVHIIKDELGKLGKEFGRFDERMKKLADHIRQAHEDAQDVRTTSQKISKRFTSIEQVELDNSESSALPNASLD
jgi:DNA recombination protein RmuC